MNIEVISQKSQFVVDLLVFGKKLRFIFEEEHKNEVSLILKSSEINVLSLCNIAVEVVNRKNGKFLKSCHKVPFSRRESLVLFYKKRCPF